MTKKYYPWGGEFTECNPKSSIAVVLLNIDYTPTSEVAIYGPLKTENIGIEKIVANIISNPNIRYILICGEEIRGHRSGESLIALNKYGINSKNKIKNAPGAIPYIEKDIVDLIGIKDIKKIENKINSLIKDKIKPFGKPYIAIRIKSKIKTIDDKRALHSKIIINYMGKVKKRGS